MIDFKWLSDIGAINATLGFFGGVSRYASGFAPKSSWGREFTMFVFASAPMAWMAGGFAAELGYTGYIEYMSAFGAGLLSHNLIKFALSLEGAELFKKIWGSR